MNNARVPLLAVGALVCLIGAAASFSWASSEALIYGLNLRGRLGVATDGPLAAAPIWVWAWWRYAWAALSGELGGAVAGKVWTWVLAGGGAGLVPGLALFLLGRHLIRKGRGDREDKPLHGATRWATESDIRQAGLRAESGIYVGWSEGKPLIFGGQESLALMAPPRSGKGVGVVIPNALLFEGSGVVLDMKREVWEATAGYRAEMGHQVFLFDPLSETGQTHRYNPLTYIRRGTVDCYSDVEKIAFVLIPDVQGPNSFFPKAARAGFIGVTTMIAESDDIPLTMESVVRVLVRDDVRDWLKRRLEDAREEGRPYTRACASACRSFLNARADTFEDVRKTITADLGLFVNPRVAAATAGNDFDLREMRHRRQWIYFAVTPANVDRLRPLLNLFWQQLTDTLTAIRPEEDPLSRHQVLFLLDEFPQLGTMPVLASAAAFVAGYNVRVVYVMQDKRQVRKLYGDAGGEALIGTTGLEIVFGTKDQGLAEELSRRIGTDTVKQRSQSRPTSLLTGGNGRDSETVSEAARPLLLPQEITRLQNREILVFRSGLPPVRAHRITHHAESPFRELVRPAPLLPAIDVPLELDEGHGPAGEKLQERGRGVSSIGAELVSPEMAAAFKAMFDATSDGEEADAISAEIENDGAVRVGQS